MRLRRERSATTCSGVMLCMAGAIDAVAAATAAHTAVLAAALSAEVHRDAACSSFPSRGECAERRRR